jgi:cell division septum initiation protein DivIVA
MDRREPDVAVARAIERVLAAEREAAGAIEAARLEAEALIETARAERRRLLERARQRASRIHAAAQARLERDLATLEREANVPTPDLDELRALTDQAVARLAHRLTAPDHERR